MKRFYKNTLISRVSSYTLRVVALLCVLIGVSSSAWASTGFYEYDGKSLSIKINGNWYDFKNDAGDFAAIDLGNYLPGKGPELQEFYYRTYLNNDNVCAQGGVYVYVNKVNKQWGYTDHQTQEDGKWPHNNYNGDWCQEWSGTVDNTIFSDITTPGKYEIGLYVKAKVGEDCNFEISLNNNSRNYKFSYTVCKPMYFFGDGATGTWNEFKVADPTSDINIVRFELKELNKQFRFSRQSSFPDSEWSFFRDAVEKGSLPEKNKGAEVIQRIDNQLQDISVKLTEQGIKDGYSEPVYFYYNTKDNKYWVEATKKTTYSVVFEDGSTYSCAGTEEGVPCIQNIELGKGTYKFKIYKNDVTYKYTSVINDALAKQELDSGGDFTTIKVSKYSNCTFTINDTDGKMYLTVSSDEIPEPVLISYNPQISTDNKSVDLHGYLQGTLCDVQGITNCGFVFCAGGSCIPTSESTIRTVVGSYGRGDSFTYTASTQGDEYFIGGVTYGYRAYVKIGNTIYLSRETGYFRLEDDCEPQKCCGEQAEPVTFTIDAALGEGFENDCKLIYGSLQTAIYKLRNSYLNEDPTQHFVTHAMTKDGNHENILLNQPVVFNVKYYDDTPNDQTKAYCYEGDTEAKYSGGGSDSEKSLALIFKDFNRENKTVEDKELGNYTLTVKGASGSARPWVHHVILRNSRNIILDNLAIFSDPSGKRQDDALEFDVSTMSWNSIPVGDCADANIVVKNCMIGSNGFTGLHASGYDGITFENNDFEAIMATTGDLDNAVAWGASAKFMFCKNIKFVRNNFRGAHATLIWFQDSRNALFMNNVFWNTNQYDAECAAVRLVNQYKGKPVEEIAFLYNTFYLQDNINTKGYDFLHSSTKESDTDSYDKITFMYNNCYSYDENVPGKYTDVSTSLTNSTICPNNFWSKKVGANFSFGNCQILPVSMVGLICETSASGPASLKIKGGGALNVGKKLSADEVNKLYNPADDLKVISTDLTYDRYNANVRPNSDTWTYGAYQGQQDITVNTIYWVGVNENWDDRNNWGFYESGIVSNSKDLVTPGASTRAADMQRLSCVNNLTDDLKVIIPENPLVQLPEPGRQWPKIPASFNAEDRKNNYGKIPVGEQVSAGLGMKDLQGNDFKPEKFAETIELEYGAALKGVEYLNDHYGKGVVNFIAPRSKWILVGNVVLPFKNGVNGETRNIVSGDYYKADNKPRVYMHKAEIKNGKPEWNTTFAELDVEVQPNEVFAIMVPDQYGDYKIPASYYYDWYGERFDPTEPLVYPPFKGRFINENEMISFTGLKVGEPNLLNNSYPCSIDAKKLEGNNKSNGKVQYYDSDARTFKTTDAVPGKVLIKPQQGFVFTPKNSSNISVSYDMLDDGNTRSRSAEIEMPLFSLNLYNANNNLNNSNIVIRYDEFLGEGNQSEADVEKAFSPIDASPELYIMAYDKRYSSIDVNSTEKVIPLGVRLLKSMNIRFEKVWFRGFSKVTLLDKAINKEYDLLTETYTTQMLEPGDIEGRFFLYLEEASDDNVEDEEEGEDTPTSIEENSDYEINIFVRELDNAIRVVTNGVELETIYVSDMAGRIMRYDVSGYSAELALPVTSGVYIVQVMGDNANRTEKVILK